MNDKQKIILCITIFLVFNFIFSKKSNAMSEIFNTDKIPSTKNFSLSEWTSKKGSIVPKKYYSNLQALMNNLEILKKNLDNATIIITPNGGYRTQKEQMIINLSSPKSKHIEALACDIKVKGFTPNQVQNMIEILIKQGKMKQGGLGKYNTFTHYDVRGTFARW